MLDLSQIHTQVSVRRESDKFCFGLPGPWGDLRDRRLQLLLCPLSVECVTKGFRISCDGQGTLLVVQPCCSPKPLDRSVPWSDKPKVRGTKLYNCHCCLFLALQGFSKIFIFEPMYLFVEEKLANMVGLPIIHSDRPRFHGKSVIVLPFGSNKDFEDMLAAL